MGQLAEYAKMALSNIRANKMRSFLTMLGIIIGISSVILIMSLGNGAKNVITESLAGIGEGQIALYTTDGTGEYQVTKEDIAALQKNVKGIRAIIGQTDGQGSTQTRKGDFSANITGVTAGYRHFDTNGLKSGRYFTQEEEEGGMPYCLLTEKDAMRLFGSTDVLGMRLSVSIWDVETDFTIIGIQNNPSDSMVSFVYDDSSVSLITPLSVFGKVYDMETDKYDCVYILSEKNADTYQVAEKSTKLMNRRHGCDADEEIYRVENFTDTMSIVNTVINMVTALVSMVAAISLIVGGIGVMNIMLVSVTERTREIGIRKALGAKTKSIMLQFLLESAIITMIGGLIGILLGIGSAGLVAKIVAMINPALTFTPKVNVVTVFVTTLFSSVIGLFFGIYPAKKAARMNPIEALRRN